MMEGQDLARDRISGLPDPLLTHILSFIPIEEAVRTCVLSKRWTKVWASLCVLVFDDHITPSFDLTREDYQQREAKFLRFLDGVMFNREIITLDTFKLKWCVNEWNAHILVCRILRCAVMCTPRVLSIRFDTDPVFKVPDSIFTCKSIEEMSLRFKNTIPDLDKDYFIKPRSITLPFLKKLELGGLNLDDDIMRMIISGCPILEELVLMDCWLGLNMISSNVLKKLVLKCCCQFSNPLMEISCPGVVSLIITSNDMQGITLKNMSSLATADFSFADDNFNLSNLSLLGGLSNVTSLNLETNSTDVMDLLLADIPNCPNLKNLKSLELGELNMSGDWNLVACLLQHSTNLKDLTLHFHQAKPSVRNCYLPSDWELLNFSPTKPSAIEDDAFRHVYLEAVKLSFPGKTVKFANELVRNMENVETSAKIIILECEGEDQGSSSAMVPSGPDGYPSSSVGPC